MERQVTDKKDCETQTDSQVQFHTAGSNRLILTDKTVESKMSALFDEDGATEFPNEVRPRFKAPRNLPDDDNWSSSSGEIENEIQKIQERILNEN